MEIKCQLDATDDFYCRSYCLLNMFQALLCPSSGAREYYTSGNCPQTGHTTLSSTPYRQLENQAPNTTGTNHLYNTLELLMMGIMVPETCWASNKFCNINHLLHVVGILFPHINDDAQSKPHQICMSVCIYVCIRCVPSCLHIHWCFNVFNFFLIVPLNPYKFIQSFLVKCILQV